MSAPGAGASRRHFAHPGWVILAASAWLATVANLPLWLAMRDLSMFGQAGGWLFALAFALIIMATLTGMVSLLAWRWTLKPVLAVLLLASAFAAYFMLAYRVVIDTSMITNALQTDIHEVRDLLSLKLVAMLLVLGVLPCAALWRWRVDYGRLDAPCGAQPLAGGRCPAGAGAAGAGQLQPAGLHHAQPQGVALPG